MELFSSFRMKLISEASSETDGGINDEAKPNEELKPVRMRKTKREIINLIRASFILITLITLADAYYLISSFTLRKHKMFSHKEEKRKI